MGIPNISAGIDCFIYDWFLFSFMVFWNFIWCINITHTILFFSLFRWTQVHNTNRWNQPQPPTFLWTHIKKSFFSWYLESQDDGDAGNPDRSFFHVSAQEPSRLDRCFPLPVPFSSWATASNCSNCHFWGPFHWVRAQGDPDMWTPLVVETLELPIKISSKSNQHGNKGREMHGCSLICT